MRGFGGKTNKNIERAARDILKIRWPVERASAFGHGFLVSLPIGAVPKLTSSNLLSCPCRF